MASDSLLTQIQAEKDEVKGYFETTGFDRWNRIYSESDEVNKVQRNIRIGHQKTVDEVVSWIKDSGAVHNVPVDEQSAIDLSGSSSIRCSTKWYYSL